MDQNFDTNPFEAILAQQQGLPSEQEQQQTPQGGMQAGPQGAMQAAQGEEVEDQLNPGQNPDSTKFLMSAVQALENYIKKSSDKDEIATARSIISLLVRLIQKDQENMASQL